MSTQDNVKWEKLDGDPATLFLGWAFTIRKALWPSLGLALREYVDPDNTKKYRELWEQKNPRYRYLYPAFFRKQKKDVEHLPDWEEWCELKDERMRVQARFLSYAHSTPRQYDFHEGDLFFSQDGNQSLQVIDAELPLEVKHIDGDKIVGYHLTEQQLADWLKVGYPPAGSQRISRNQSRKELARFYEYSA